ncbi:MAG: Crp/Fnr family transcriptional regulator [Lachnospiraceae bacterium]|nr:Crp/Fnr family transcriptional regulator [Lachnospiraceae bacterium]
MQNLLPILQKCPLFDGIFADELSALLTCLSARVQNYAKNAYIFREGDPATFIGIVLSGSAHLMREDYLGNRSLVARIAPGELFGESYSCSGISTLPINIIADEDSQVMLIDCRRVTVSCSQACSFHNRMVTNLLRLVAAKNLVLHQKIEITSRRSTREKLMAYLLAQAKQHKSNYFTIPYDRQALADYLEVDRSGLSAEIGKLKREGVLDSDRNTFRLLSTKNNIREV